MKVCYFGAYDLEYPRNRVIRQGLVANGVEIVVCNVSQSLKTWQRVPRLAHQFLGVGRQCDMILVAEFGQSLVPVAWLLSRFCGKPLVFDAFMSFYDTAVGDRRTVAPGSIGARYYHFLDRLALLLADAVLVDTEQNRQYFAREFSIAFSKLHVIYVGVDDTVFSPRLRARTVNEHFLVLFYGTYIPLHGIEHIISAAKLLEGQPNLTFELIGRGQTFEQMKALARRLKVSNLLFAEPVPYTSLPERIARADLCLGIFGDTDKARRIIPNKVFQSMAMRKPVLTGDSLAIREIFTDGVHLSLCPMSDANSLAEAILRLRDDKPLRVMIAEGGYHLIKERFVPAVLGKEMKDFLQGIAGG